MLKFFRRIRRRLLAENRLRNYSLYAIGEILLVVIGILIALQINTWNEDRKSRSQEASLLVKLADDIASNQQQIQQTMAYDSSSLQAIEELFRLLEQDRPYTDSVPVLLRRAVSSWPPLLTSSTMETIRAKGVDIIQSDSIRQQVLNLYDVGYDALERMYELDERSADVELRYWLQHFRLDNQGFTPNNYAAIRQDPQLLNILSLRRYMRSNALFFKSNVVDRSERLLGAIEGYLGG